jgi:hypothetical protein
MGLDGAELCKYESSFIALRRSLKIFCNSMTYLASLMAVCRVYSRHGVKMRLMNSFH